jgi:hypothetical protein
MTIGADILIVIGTMVTGLAFSSVVAGWVARSWPVMALISLAIGIALLVFVHFQLPDGLAPMDIPDAFILVAARILN